METRSPPMHKRVIPLICTFAVLISMLAIPTYADEIKNDFINLLDYTTPNTTGENTVSISPQDKLVNFELPLHSDIRYIELTFSLSGEFFTPSVFLYMIHNEGAVPGTVREQLIVKYLGNNLWRAYTTTYWDDKTYIGIEFSNVPERQYVTFYDVSIASENTYPDPIPADGYIHDIGNMNREYYLYHTTTGEYNIPEWTPNSGNTAFIAVFDILDWQGFDYIDIVCTSYCEEITSVSVTHGLGNLPFTANVINSSGSYGYNIVTLRIDLSGVRKDSINDPFVEITGLGSPEHASNFSIRACSGITLLEEPNIVVFWGNKFLNAINSMSVNIGSSISSGVNNLRGGLNGIVTSIGEWGQKILDALGGQGDTSGFQDDVEDVRQDLENASDALDDFTLPPVESVIPDLDQYIDIDPQSNFALVMDGIMSNELYQTLTFAGVAIWLFGIIFGV